MPPEIAILSLTKGGGKLAERLASLLPSSEIVSGQGNIHKTLAQAWHKHSSLICIMAAGIVTRSIAPLLRDKTTDPAVVLCDEQGRFAVSLLSGHLGGGNALAHQVAHLLGGQAVITTASDVLGRTALDIWAREQGLIVADKQQFTRVTAKLVNTGTVSLHSDYPLPDLPPDIIPQQNAATADLLITCRTALDCGANKALLHPKTLTAGIGCNRSTPVEEIAEALRQTCTEHNLAFQALGRLASIDLKSDEVGLLALARQLNLPIDFYTPDQLNRVEGVSTSAAVLKATGAKGVAEPAAILSAGNGTLLVKKIKYPHVTVAIAEVSKL